MEVYMKKIIFSLTVLFLLTSQAVAAQEVKILTNDVFSGSVKAEHDGLDPSVFVQDNNSALKNNGKEVKKASLKPTLTGVISFGLQEGVDANTFIQDYALKIRDVSRLNMVDAVPVDRLNLTNLADIETFFELAAQLKASDDVLWVQMGRADKHYKTK